MTTMPQPLAVILIDHGSRRAEANQALSRMAELARQRLGVPVYPAHMDLAAPSLAEALAQAAEGGARRVVVCPYFLAPGRHGADDIPRLARQAAEGLPQLEVLVSEPLGADPLLAELIARRVEPLLHPGEPA